MAEYIEKQELKTYLDCKIDFGGIDNRLMVLGKIDEIPTADVVERSKIDKAIEEGYEIRKSILQSNDNYTVNDVLDIIDEILEPFEELYKG